MAKFKQEEKVIRLIFNKIRRERHAKCRSRWLAIIITLAFFGIISALFGIFTYCFFNNTELSISIIGYSMVITVFLALIGECITTSSD